MQAQRKTQIKKQQPRSCLPVLSADEIKERREAEQFNRCMSMMKSIALIVADITKPTQPKGETS